MQARALNSRLVLERRLKACNRDDFIKLFKVLAKLVPYTHIFL